MTRELAAMTYGRDDYNWQIEAQITEKLLDAMGAKVRRLELQVDHFRKAEHDLSRAYVRLRTLIPGALDTPYAPSTEEIQQITEASLRKLVERAEVAQRTAAEAVADEREACARLMDREAELMSAAPRPISRYLKALAARIRARSSGASS